MFTRCDFARIKKAISEECVGPELFRMAPAAAAAAHSPLHLKCLARVETPLQHRGGLLCELYKKRGPTTTCSSFCDLTIRHNEGKSLGVLLRSRAFPSLWSAADIAGCDTHLGSGLNGGSTDLTHLIVRSIVDFAFVRKLCLAPLFFDVNIPFPAMIRAVVLPIPQSREELICRMQAAGYLPDVVLFVLDALAGRDFWADDRGSKHYLNFLLSATNPPGGLLNFCQASSQSRVVPLPPLTLPISFVLSSNGSTLFAAGLAFSVPAGVSVLFETAPAICDVTLPIHEIAYFDGVVVHVLAPAAQLVSATSDAVAVTKDTFTQHGLTSMALFRYFGAGSKAVRAQVESVLCNKIVVRLQRDRAVVAINACRVYKHVGTKASASAPPTNEIPAKCKLIKTAIASIQPVPRCDSIDIHAHALVLVLNVLAKSLFQSAMWPLLRKGEYNRVDAALLRAYRTLLPPASKRDPDTWCSDEYVIKATLLPAADVLLHKLRLGLFFRVVTKALMRLRVLLSAAASAARSWHREFQDSISWAVNCTFQIHFCLVHDRSAPPFVAQSLPIVLNQLTCFIDSSPKLFSEVPSAAAKSVDHNDDSIRKRSGSEHLRGDPPVRVGVFPCATCERVLPTLQSLAVHCAVRHRQPRAASRLVTTTMCTA